MSGDVRGELCSSLGAACSEKGLAGAPDNEVDDVDEEDEEQRNCVVYLLWVGAGISARPRGCAPSAVRCTVGQLPAKGREHSPPDSSQASESLDSFPKLSSAHNYRCSQHAHDGDGEITLGASRRMNDFD